MKIKILLVEDDTSLGFIISDHLKSEGYHVTLCSDGAEGFKRFNEEVFHLCIFDVMMPKKDGFSLGLLVQHVIETLGIDAEGFKIEIKEYAQEIFTTLDNMYKKITTIDSTFLQSCTLFINKLLSPINMVDLDTRNIFKQAKEEVSNKFRNRIISHQKNNSKQYCLS